MTSNNLFEQPRRFMCSARRMSAGRAAQLDR
jgi:hypothetical protein